MHQGSGGIKIDTLLSTRMGDESSRDSAIPHNVRVVVGDWLWWSRHHSLSSLFPHRNPSAMSYCPLNTGRGTTSVNGMQRRACHMVVYWLSLNCLITRRTKAHSPDPILGCHVGFWTASIWIGLIAPAHTTGFYPVYDMLPIYVPRDWDESSLPHHDGLAMASISLDHLRGYAPNAHVCTNWKIFMR